MDDDQLTPEERWAGYAELPSRVILEEHRAYILSRYDDDSWPVTDFISRHFEDVSPVLLISIASAVARTQPGDAATPAATAVDCTVEDVAAAALAFVALSRTDSRIIAACRCMQAPGIALCTADAMRAAARQLADLTDAARSIAIRLADDALEDRSEQTWTLSELLTTAELLAR